MLAKSHPVGSLMEKRDWESESEFVYEKASLTSDQGIQYLYINTTLLKTFTHIERETLPSCCLVLNGLHTIDVRSK